MIDPLTLEQLVSWADFVGVVECETAGGIVAEYRVIEGWKGAPAGTRFRLKTPVDFWEPQFPTVLVGDRSVVTAFASKPPSRVVSTTSGGGVPLWWRDVPHEYSLPLFQGRAGVPDAAATGRKYFAFGEKFDDFGQFKARVQKFLALSPEQSEVAMMRSLYGKYARRHRKPQRETAKIRELKERIATAQTAAQMANALLTLRWKDKHARVSPALARGGGAATLRFLEALDDKQWPLDKAERGRVLNSIRSRLGLPQKVIRVAPSTPKGEEIHIPAATPRSDAAERAKMRALLADKTKTADDSYEIMRAIEVLTPIEPEVVARYLVEWENSRDGWRDAERGYVMGCYFAWRCGGERAAHLRRLAGARDPHVRVAGAVYLCFEDRDEGMAALRKVTELPGDAGAWAALNLARRGDKRAMPRALRVFATPGEGSMAGVAHRNLGKRLLVLLSNSAHRSRVPAPLVGFVAPAISGDDDEKARVMAQYEHLRNWWKTHEAKIELKDPWLPLLEAQKID